MPVELFPKSDNVEPGRYGNQVKLVGALHRVSGRRSEFVGKVPVPLPVNTFERLLAKLPPEQHAARPQMDSRFPCLAAIQNEGVTEGGRNIQLTHLAVMLRRAGVEPEYVELLVERVNEKGDPVDQQELSSILENAANIGPLCTQLPTDRTCGDLCLLERTQGLQARPGQLRHAADGERAVVVVKAHIGSDVIELEHDDIDVGKVRLRPQGGEK